PRGRKPVLPFAHISGLLQLLIQLSPQELGYQRSRWSTELMALELKRSWRLTLHASTIRRWLPRLGIVWRRAAPTLHIRDPHKERKMAAINEALGRCSADHPVFYEDEVDIHL
ncbi:winged helix-turn-helix domain-containing protein, partial [Aeromonas caviae]